MCTSQRCPNFAGANADEFFATSRREIAQVAEQYDVTKHVPRLRSQVAAFTADFASLVRSVEVAGGGARLWLAREELTRLSITFASSTMRGLRLLSEMSAVTCSKPLPIAWDPTPHTPRPI